MNGERKLSLVKPPASAPASDEALAGAAAALPSASALPADEPEITEDELREAEALRKALDRGDDPVAAALRAAFKPAALVEGDLDAILARALGVGVGVGGVDGVEGAEGTDAPATSIEAREAERLRVALDQHDGQRAGRVAMGPGARAATRDEDSSAIAVALRAAWAPAPLAATKNETLVKRALDAAAIGAVSASVTGAANASATGAASASATGAASASATGAVSASATGAANASATGAASASVTGAASAPGKGALDVPLAAVGASGARAVAGAQKAANEKEAPAPISLRRFRLGPRTFATMTAVVALAAGVLLFVGRLGQHAEPAASVAQAPAASPQANAVAALERTPRIASRSTTDLFDAATPFPRSGGETARVDRIAGARAADLRANRFAAWGVR